MADCYSWTQLYGMSLYKAHWNWFKHFQKYCTPVCAKKKTNSQRRCLQRKRIERRLIPSNKNTICFYFKNIHNLTSKVIMKPSRPFCLVHRPTPYLLLASILSHMKDQHEFGGRWWGTSYLQWVKSQKKNLHLHSLLRVNPYDVNHAFVL